MDTPEQAELRQAVRQRTEAVGLRKMARQIGLSASGLKKALAGGKLQEATWTKFREWYVREVAEREEPAQDSGAVLLEALLRQVAPTLRPRIRTTIVEEVGRIYGEEKLPAPAWLVDVPGGLEAYEGASQEQPFALVELARGERFYLREPPIAGDPRNVAEEIANVRGVWRGESYYPPHRIIRVHLGGGAGEGATQ